MNLFSRDNGNAKPSAKGFALVLILLASAKHLEASNGESPNQSQDPMGEPHFKMLTLIDWNGYTKMFNKQYSSLAQQLARQKIFMANKMKVLLTYIKYKFALANYYTCINKYSDLTPEEGRKLLSGDGDGGQREAESMRRSTQEGGGNRQEGDDDFMDDDEAERTLHEALDDEYSSEDIAIIEIRKRRSKRHQRTKRHTTELAECRGDCDQMELNDLIRSPEKEWKSERWQQQLKTKRVVPSNNPNYMQISQGLVARAEHKPLDDIPEAGLKRIQDEAYESRLQVNLKQEDWLSSLGRTVLGAVNWLHSSPQPPGGEKQPQVASRTIERNSEPPNDTLLVDWRKSGCIGPPIEQDNCDCCYAISSMAFVEWTFCINQENVLTPLSVQYMISCGPQFKEETGGKMGFEGCRGGLTKHTMNFVKEYGVELEANMPFLNAEAQCPVEPHTPLKEKGYIRPHVKQTIRMRGTTTRLDLALRVGPVIVSFREPVDFLAYGGGMIDRCYPKGGHAMLIVGSGIENGVEYLLIKNSFGPNWGMDGYFKFKRTASEECVIQFIFPRLRFPGKKAQARQIKAYLARHQYEPPTTGEGGNYRDLSDFEAYFDVGAGGLFS